MVGKLREHWILKLLLMHMVFQIINRKKEILRTQNFEKEMLLSYYRRTIRTKSAQMAHNHSRNEEEQPSYHLK